ncbi:MAG: TlpA disulfide reductase family protein [Gammaproteobacteria bacterium]
MLSATLPAGSVAEPAPACLAGLEAAPAAGFAAYAGRVLMVDFWASWCPPCRRAMPWLNTLYAELREDGLTVLAINVDEERDAAREFLDRVPVDYPVVFDPAGNCPARFALEAMPSTYFLDRAGRIRYVHQGFRDRDRDTLRALALELLGE